MKDIPVHLPNERLEDLEDFALVFFIHMQTRLLFLQIWLIAK